MIPGTPLSRKLNFKKTFLMIPARSQLVVLMEQDMLIPDTIVVKPLLREARAGFAICW